jgi:hypothetical protein
MNYLNMTTTTAPAAGDNSMARLDAILEKMGVLGKAEAIGTGSRRDAGVALTAAAAEGMLLEGDAEAAYDAYYNALGRTVAKKHLSGAGDNIRSRQAQISKFRAFIKVGMLPEPVDGRVVLARAVTIAEENFGAGVKVLSPFEALRTVAVAQLAKPTEPLTDAEISAAVSKAEREEKDTMQKLVAAYKAAAKLAADVPSVHTEGAVKLYGDAIVEAGGDIPQSKAEKEAAEFMAKAAAMGFVMRAIAAE